MPGQSRWASAFSAQTGRELSMMAKTQLHKEGPEYFPVVQSLLSPQALVRQVLAQYDLGERIECKLLRHNLNDVYLVVTPNQRYVLRVSQAPRSAGRTWRTAFEILY